MAAALPITEALAAARQTTVVLQTADLVAALKALRAVLEVQMGQMVVLEEGLPQGLRLTVGSRLSFRRAGSGPAARRGTIRPS